MRSRIFLIAAPILLSAVALWFSGVPVRQFAAAFLADSHITPDYLKETFKSAEPIKVLLVPGHDETSPGARYRGIREENLNVLAGEELYRYLKQNNAFEPKLVRNRGGYTADFESYYVRNRSAIEAFRARLWEAMRELFASGEAEQHRGPVIHNAAPSRVANRLYGINKWANDTGVDIVIHIHFNDHNRSLEPYRRYSGFSIYIPERQLPNHEASRAIAEHIHDAMDDYFPVSDLPGESTGIVEDQELIAVGANGSLDPAVAFMEYSYIYETQVRHPDIRPLAVREFAYQTYRGLLSFFGKTNQNSFPKTATLPYTWTRTLSYGEKYSADVFALQLALRERGLYPPAGKTGNACPITGNYGPCTRAAVRGFQYAHGISPVGHVGPQTLAQLNELFSFTTVLNSR